MTDLIQRMETALAQLDTQWAALIAAIQALRGVNGAAPVRKLVRAKKSRPDAPRGHGRANRNATDERVMAAVKDGCLTFAAVAAKTGVPDYNVRQALKRLVAAKRVTREGATTNTRFRVAA